MCWCNISISVSVFEKNDAEIGPVYNSDCEGVDAVRCGGVSEGGGVRGGARVWRVF